MSKKTAISQLTTKLVFELKVPRSKFAKWINESSIDEVKAKDYLKVDMYELANTLIGKEEVEEESAA